MALTGRRIDEIQSRMIQADREPIETFAKRMETQENKMWQECFGFIENATAADAVPEPPQKERMVDDFGYSFGAAAAEGEGADRKEDAERE